MFSKCRLGFSLTWGGRGRRQPHSSQAAAPTRKTLGFYGRPTAGLTLWMEEHGLLIPSVSHSPRCGR